MTNDEQAIRDLVATWMKASASGDLPTLLELMSDDVVFLTPGREPFGRKDFEARFQSMQGQVSLKGSSAVQEVHVNGDMAYCRTTLTITMTSSTTGESKERSGHTLSVLRKNSSGNSVIERDANLVM